MKWAGFCVTAICLANLSTAAAQDAPDITVFSFDDITCAAWTRSQGDPAVRAVYGTWFRGFVSGYNFGNPANQVHLGHLPDPADVALYVDKFCRDNPGLSFVAAAVPLEQERREIIGPIPERKA